MNLSASLFSEAEVHRLGWVLLHLVWQASAIALLLSVLLRLLASASAHVRYLVICGALLSCGVVPILTWNALGARSTPSGMDVATPITLVSEVVAVNTRMKENPGSEPAQSLPGSTEKGWQDHFNQATSYVVYLWLAGVLILTVRTTVGWSLMWRLCLEGQPIYDSLYVSKFQRLSRRMQIRPPVRLLQSALVEVPTVIGWLRPAILIPPSAFMGLSPDQFEAILAHELAHIRRYDYLVNLLQTALETIIFYHPAVWWISGKLREEREHCCDDIAVEVMEDRLIYVRALAQLEEGRVMQLTLAATGGSLLQRVKRLVGKTENRGAAWPLWLLILGILAVTSAAQVRAVEKQQTAESAKLSTERFDELVNQLRIEKLKVKNLPVNEFINQISKELMELDPKKQGLKFVLEIPEGEPPVRVSLDFTGIPGYRANIVMILDPIKANYPIRYKINDNGSILIKQISNSEISFNKKANSTFIDINFNDADPVSALEFVQTASKSAGFPFALDLKPIRTLASAHQLPAIDLQANKVSVGQALRSIFYLADLAPEPLDHIAGYRIQPQSPEVTKGHTWLAVGSGVTSFKAGTGGAEKQMQASLRQKKAESWIGPSTNGPAYNPSGLNCLWSQPVSPQGVQSLNEKLQQQYSVNPTVVSKTQIDIAPTLEIIDSHGKSVRRVSGHATLASGMRAVLSSSGSATLSLPANGRDPGLDFVGLVQVTLINEDGQPLLPPPSTPVKELQVLPRN